MKSEKNKILVAFGISLKFWRKIKRLDQQGISDLIGTSRSYVAKIEKAHVGVSFERILVIADALGINYLTLLHCPDEKAVEILKDIYDDLEIDVSKHELEILWNQSLFKGSDATLNNYKILLDVYRGEGRTKNEAPLVEDRDYEPKEKAYYLKRMGKKPTAAKLTS